MILHLFDTNTFSNVAIIDHRNGDVSDLYIRMNKKAPNQLRITITSKFSRFQQLLTDKSFGIRVVETDQDLLFVFKGRKVTDKHCVELEMMSYAYTLMTTPVHNLNRILRDYSLITFLGELDSNFVFTPIDGDTTFDIVTGADDNLKLLTEAVTYTEYWGWVDAGLILVGGDLRPNIVFGDFRKIELYYNTSGDERFKPLEINNITTTDNIYDDDRSFLVNAEQTDTSEGYSLIFPYVNNGSGFSQSNTIRLRSSTYSFMNPQFPIIEVTSPVTSETYYCVRNPFVTGSEKMKVYEYEQPSNTRDINDTLDTSTEVTEEVLYKRTIAYIQSLQSRPILTVTPNFKKVVMAGTKAKVNQATVIRRYDNSVIYEQDYSGEYILDDLEFNLNDFAS